MNSECPNCGETVVEGTECEVCGHILGVPPESDSFEVIVGNVGNVYQGPSREQAEACWRTYVEQSKSGVGRAGNESVILFAHGDPDPNFDYEPEGE